MKNKAIFIVCLFFSVFIFFNQSISTIKYRSQCENDQQFTALLQKNKFLNNQSYQRLLAKEKLNFNFTAKHNNLGTIAFLFDNHQKINSDWVWFRIKEINSDSWYYQNKYNTDQFNPEYYFTFGFPIINNSKNKEYTIEIESISGTSSDSISLNSKSNNFLAKYSFSKNYLKQNPSQIFYLIINKIKYYLSYIPKSDINKIIIKSIIPLLVFLLFRFKIFSLSEKKLRHIQNNHKLTKIINILLPLTIFLSTFLVSGFFATIGADAHHDGIMFKPALDVSRGLMLFKDTFTLYGALTTIIQAIAIKIFGEYLIVIKLTTAFIYALISVCLYSIWSKFLNKRLTFLSCLIWLFLAPYYIMTFLPWSSVYALLFQCLTIIFFQRYAKNKQPLNLLLAGAMSALTFWCKQNVGLYTILGSLFSIFIIKNLQNQKNKIVFKNIIKYIIGGVVVSIPIFIWIIFNNAFIDWWKQSIQLSSIWISTKDSSNLFDNFFPEAIGPISIWAITPIIALYITIKQLIAKKKDNFLLIVCIFGIFSWLQYYPVTCIRHTYWAITPLFGVVSYYLYNLNFNNKKINKYKILIFLIIFAAIIGPDISKRIELGLISLKTKFRNINEPGVLKNIKLSSDEANFYSELYKDIQDYVNKNGPTDLITTGPNALCLTFRESKNFHPMYIDWSELNTIIYPDYIKIRDLYITNNKPLIIYMWGPIPTGYCRLNPQSILNSTFLLTPCK